MSNEKPTKTRRKRQSTAPELAGRALKIYNDFAAREANECRRHMAKMAEIEAQREAHVASLSDEVRPLFAVMLQAQEPEPEPIDRAGR